jgi:hypothetical protein
LIQWRHDIGPNGRKVSGKDLIQWRHDICPNDKRQNDNFFYTFMTVLYDKVK